MKSDFFIYQRKLVISKKRILRNQIVFKKSLYIVIITKLSCFVNNPRFLIDEIIKIRDGIAS